jgi:hypothetical protein
MTGAAGRALVTLVLVLAHAFASERATFAAPAAAFGAQVALAEPEGGFVGRMAVIPERGPVGTPLAVTAEGLPAEQEFELVWRTVQGRWNVANGEYRGREYVPVAYRIAKVRTDSAGRLRATFAAPEDFGFSHDIVLQRGSRLFSQTAFELEMTVTVSPASGPVGTPITIDVKGIGWRQLQNSWLLLYDNNFTGWISAVTTGGSATFTIPATGRPGLHVLEILHGDFTFPYRNMQQSPEPDRPRFVRHFTITPGEAVLPPPPAQQTQSAVRRLPAPGALVAEPAFAPVGAAVVVRGDGLSPNETYKLHWNSVTGNRVSGGGWHESSRAVADAKADDSGTIAFRFEVPDDLGGAHELWLEEDGAAKKSGTYWIAPSAMPLDAARGPAGTPFTIHLKGVGWSETANIYTVVYDNGYIGYACGFNSNGDVEIFLQATGAPGWHFIDLYPAIYKGTEGRPINFRIPQLTYADDHPGEDLPRFRFAFYITESAPRVGQ